MTTSSSESESESESEVDFPGTLVPTPPPHDPFVSPTLAQAIQRLEFPPLYILVGVYRLCSDEKLRKPAWDKCRHGVVCGVVVGFLWALFTFRVQKKIIEVFIANSPRVTGLSLESVVLFGYKVPFSLPTFAAGLTLGDQVTLILRFFLSRSICITRDRAWEQTVHSRGKGPDFWQPYVEEWDSPPPVVTKRGWDTWAAGWVGGMLIRRVLLYPFALYPLVGTLVSAALTGLGTATYLHKQYFDAKKMTPAQQSTFIQERTWDYRAFGFTAALLEGLPFIGLFFTVSNRIGAAMWAHDLEKRQHHVAEQKLQRLKVE